MLVILLLLSLVPIYLMVEVSFKNPLQYLYQRWTPSFPLRLGNYAVAWSMVGSYIWNTAFVASIGVLGTLVLSLIGAHVFARMRFPFREQLYVALISVLMVPWVISFIPQYMIYHFLGMINTRWALIVPIFAHTPVLGIFILRAFLEGIPEEMYEAARCDGAGVWRQIVSISLPLSLPALATIAVVSFLGTWNWFLWPLVVISDGSKQLISVGLWRLQDDLGRFARIGAAEGPTFAGYVIASVPLVLLFAVLGKYYVEGLVQSGVKG